MHYTHEEFISATPLHVQLCSNEQTKGSGIPTFGVCCFFFPNIFLIHCSPIKQKLPEEIFCIFSLDLHKAFYWFGNTRDLYQKLIFQVIFMPLHWVLPTRCSSFSKISANRTLTLLGLPAVHTRLLQLPKIHLFKKILLGHNRGWNKREQEEWLSHHLPGLVTWGQEKSSAPAVIVPSDPALLELYQMLEMQIIKLAFLKYSN